MAAKRNSISPKVTALLAEGTFNPAAEKVRDPKFRAHEFFDPRDLVQVKYELLRRVSLEHVSVTAATVEYGVSRPTYYQAKANFAIAGIAGLGPWGVARFRSGCQRKYRLSNKGGWHRSR